MSYYSVCNDHNTFKNTWSCSYSVSDHKIKPKTPNDKNATSASETLLNIYNNVWMMSPLKNKTDKTIKEIASEIRNGFINKYNKERNIVCRSWDWLIERFGFETKWSRVDKIYNDIITVGSTRGVRVEVTMKSGQTDRRMKSMIEVRSSNIDIISECSKKEMTGGITMKVGNKEYFFPFDDEGKPQPDASGITYESFMKNLK